MTRHRACATAGSDRCALVPEGDSPGGQWGAGRRGESGETRLVQRADVKNWKPFSGQPYDWHQQEIEMADRRRVEAEEKALVEAFRNEFKFEDGRSLTVGMFVNVNADAPGDLGMFAGRRLRITNVDYRSRTVKLKQFGWEEPEFEQFLEVIAACDVGSGTPQDSAPAIERQTVKLQSGAGVA